MISVIVPVYNIERYLQQCIESICVQTYRDLDIILVDDGSTDQSGKICDRFERKDSRIKVVHRRNGGLVSARKAGLQHAVGEYIAYVDGDDWIEPDMYEKMYHKLLKHDADIVMCGRYEDTGKVSKEVYHGMEEGYYDKTRLLKEMYPEMITGKEFFEWKIFPGVWDKLFKRKCLEEFQMSVDDSIVMGEDAVCTYSALLNAGSIYIIHECLYHYRQTTSSMVKQRNDMTVERKRYQVLYQGGKESFEKYAHIYDLQYQWKKYVLFLMLPRADALYEDFENLDYLFPFSDVKKGERIILYGAGTYGQRLYSFLEQSGFCRVVAWVDRNYKEFQKFGLEVQSPGVIPDVDYDAIVIANTYAKSRTGLYEELIKKYPEDKVHLMDEELIFSEETFKKFRLISS